ncbi:flavin reductase family protein [Paenibacillus sambharensis]|uniref:Flavin reductase family protein n=1 Tax=Paenibacillus sambharensis TaxID=1803190 RepID=A0A2W1LAV0_9BACL|nr:flavin reductase family protein [Paenibacillus sambharensis]PZD96023.1 flavin reductase family protein [Paenibacillus sambharensis]
MIAVDPAGQSGRDTYKLLIGSIVPRPIALVTTLADNGTVNAAPFSFFSIVSSDPPLLSVAVQRRQGVMKDTARHAIEQRELVIHIVSEEIVEAVNQTAANLPPGDSELAAAGFTAVISESVRVPGIAEAKIRMECRLDQAIGLGDSGQPSCDLLIARVLKFHIAEELYNEHGHIDAGLLNPVSRMAGDDYALIGRVFSLKRPE